MYDGDTVVVEGKWRARVRLIDCWAPEVRGKEKEDGFRSRDHLKGIAEGKTAVLHVPGHLDIGKATSMSRVLGSIWLEDSDESLSEVMVRDGYATKKKATK